MLVVPAARGLSERLNQMYSMGLHISYRFLNSADVSTALRPFYFNVHPDLFGKYPEERTINENSLKALSGYLETVQKHRPINPVELQFYIRPSSNTKGHTLKSVRVILRDKSLRKTVLSILESCNLPTSHLKPEEKTYDLKEFRNNLSKREAEFYENDPIIGSLIRKMKKKSEMESHLRPWLENHYETAREYLKSYEPIRVEIERLKLQLCKDLGLKSIEWDCGWSISHFRGALLSFQALLGHHSGAVSSLKDKTLIFGSDTGVNLDGEVMLNCGEVRHNWLELLKKVQKDDEVLARLPAFERAVSRVLRDIKVVHRKFQPKVMAIQYEGQLRRLTTSLSDFQGRLGYPKHWPETLAFFQLVVETEAGPLMLSPTGQFIVPSSCPAFLLVNFITENLEVAAQRLQDYQRNKLIEDQIVTQVVQTFSLTSLRKDDNITPSLMINFCESLLKNQEVLKTYLNGASVFVTTYYSLLTDGQMCLPWNWKI